MTLGDDDVFSELVRLRETIKRAEWAGSYGEIPPGKQNILLGHLCPWCRAKQEDGRHFSDCRAFQPKGKVR